MIPMWRASLRTCSAVLDRVWFYPAGLGISKVFSKWAEEATSFDHALIYIKIPHSEAGTGFAGACLDGWQESTPPRLLVDMQLLKTRRDEFSMAVREEVRQLQSDGKVREPFEALAAVNEIASQLA